MNETVDLLARIVGLLVSLGGMAFGLYKGIIWISRDRRQEKHSAARWEIESFQANIKALQDENGRCWGMIDRIEKEIVEKDKEIERLEQRVKYRTDQVHELNNLLQFYVMEYGDVNRIKQREKERTDERQERRDANDENGDPQ